MVILGGAGQGLLMSEKPVSKQMDSKNKKRNNYPSRSKRKNNTVKVSAFNRK